jgi:VanZ family protein
LLLYWLPALLWLVMVAIFSSPRFSAGQTGVVLTTLLAWLDVKLSSAGMLVLHFAIRKSAHFIAYGVLSALFFRAVRGPLPDTMWRVSWALVALAICMVTASADEVNQSLTPGREGAVRDVMLDMAGALFAQLLILVAYLGKAGRRAKVSRG